MTAQPQSSDSSRRNERRRTGAELKTSADPVIELLAQTRCLYSLPLDAFWAIERHFSRRLVRPVEDVPWPEGLDCTIQHRSDTVEVETRAGYLLQKWLKDEGYQTRLRFDRLDPHLMTVDTARLNARIDPMWHMPEVLTSHFTGQFEVKSPREVPDLVAALVSAFPDAPCLMPFASISAAIAFREQLRPVVDEPITLMRGLNQRPGSRLVVCTDRAAGSGDYTAFPLVIFPQWPGSLHQRMKLLARQPEMQRMYLIRTEQDAVSARDEEELLHRVGPMLWQFGRIAPRAQHIFHVVNFGGLVREGNAPRGSPINKRKLYWRHSRRNQHIASLAQQLDADTGSFRSLATSRQRVAVLVETTEHAHKLGGLLRGWPIVTQDAAASPLPPRCIVTLRAAEACPSFAPHFLINACGGPASPWLEAWLDGRALGRTAIALIDFSDGFSGEAANHSQNRQASYKRAGAVWRPLPMCIVKPALDALRNSAR